MTKNIFTKTNGFSLLEMAIAMGIVVILTSAIAPVAIKQVQIKAGEKSAREINIIQEAARKFYIDNNAWPAAIDDLKSGGYLNPAWTTTNPWGFVYSISSNTSTFSVDNQVPASIVNLLTRSLPSSSSVANVVTSTIPTPGTLSLAPAGVIVAWSGSIANIPIGWVLCDGTNGTPDLRDKFIVGARQDVAGRAESNVTGVLLQTGGAATHNHSGQTGAHQLTIAEMPSHHHGYLSSPWLGARYDGHTSPVVQGQVSSVTDDTGGDLAHSHSISADSNVPPFYSLAYIMKT